MRPIKLIPILGKYAKITLAAHEIRIRVPRGTDQDLLIRLARQAEAEASDTVFTLRGKVDLRHSDSASVNLYNQNQATPSVKARVER